MREFVTPYYGDVDARCANHETKYNVEDKVTHWELGFILKLFKEYIGKRINELTRNKSPKTLDHSNSIDSSWVSFKP